MEKKDNKATKNMAELGAVATAARTYTIGRLFEPYSDHFCGFLISRSETTQMGRPRVSCALCVAPTICRKMRQIGNSKEEHGRKKWWER